MDYIYTPVKNGNDDVVTWKYLFRQLLICIGIWIFYFVAGLYFGTPTVMIAQIRKEANSTAAVSEEMASWLSSLHGYSAMPWTIILPVLSEIYGRKIPSNITFIVVMVGYILMYFSTDVVSILIAEIILGIVVGCNLTYSVIVITEYSSPKYRGVLLTMKSASFFWGILTANIIGTYFHWRNITLLALVLLVFNISSFFWPQSPHWLATKGRFEECARAHRLLKGTSEESENELKQLIISQKNYFKNHPIHTKVLSCERLMNFFKIISNKVVYKPIFISLVLLVMYGVSGKLACHMYAIQILKKITGNESIAYKGMLILDAVSLVGMYIGCYLATFLKRRTMLFTATSCSVLFLLLLSLYLYLIKLEYISDNSYVSLTMLTIFSISISCGPMLLSTSIFGELIPLRYKGYAIIVIVLLDNIFISTLLKFTPFIFKVAGLHGTFLFYGISVFNCLLILYFYLPETKDKTLIEIEEYFEK